MCNGTMVQFKDVGINYGIKKSNELLVTTYTVYTLEAVTVYSFVSRSHYHHVNHLSSLVHCLLLWIVDPR